MTTTDIFKQTYKWEYDKGNTNNPNDKGGDTNDGITLQHYQTYCLSVLGVTPQYSHFLKLTQVEVFKFYERIFQRMGCHMIQCQRLAGVVFDFGFNSGYGKREIQLVLQRLGYDIAADNVFGPATLSALNKAYTLYGDVVIDLIFIQRLGYVAQLCYREKSQQGFLKGWYNRVADWRLFVQTV